MSKDEILALSDADLVRHVAERVMGGYLEGDAIGEGILRQHRIPGERWEPLHSWDHCSFVWEAMRAKGWGFAIHYDRSVEFYTGKTWHDVECDPGNERRAILQAALIAVNAKAVTA